MKGQPKVLMIALVQQKKISINLSKARTIFYLSLHYNGDEIYLYVIKQRFTNLRRM